MIVVNHVDQIEVVVNQNEILISQCDLGQIDGDVIAFHAEHVDAIVAALLRAKKEAMAWVDDAERE